MRGLAGTNHNRGGQRTSENVAESAGRSRWAAAAACRIPAVIVLIPGNYNDRVLAPRRGVHDLGDGLLQEGIAQLNRPMIQARGWIAARGIAQRAAIGDTVHIVALVWADPNEVRGAVGGQIVIKLGHGNDIRHAARTIADAREIHEWVVFLCRSEEHT